MVFNIHQKIIENVIGKSIHDLELRCKYENIDGGTFIYIFYVKNGLLKKDWHIAEIVGNNPNCKISQPALSSKKEAEKGSNKWCELASLQEDALDELPPKYEPIRKEKEE